jgi:KaiC/GvpD/RAD55 family RecA-like ATPase
MPAIDVAATDPYRLAFRLVGGIKPDHELWYAVMWSVRHHFKFDLSHETVRLFQLMARAANAFCTTETGGKAQKSLIGRGRYKCHYRKQFVSALRLVLRTDERSEDESLRSVEFFSECCRATGYILADYKEGYLAITTSRFDANYLISRVFGMPTGILGFDQLFGSGGIMLTEVLHHDPCPGQTGGRVILVRGKYGTGKSILSLQLAVEVAQKGGLAWVIPMGEQSSDDCLQTIESMCGLPPTESMIVATDVSKALQALENRKPDQGVLVILKTVEKSCEGFITAFSDNLQEMQKYSLRLVVVDPINSVCDDGTQRMLHRVEMVKMIETVKPTGTNVLFVAEEDSGPGGELRFAEYVSDTVIRLSVDDVHHYAQRYFEIKKSRLQREQRGRHPFSILGGAGITIFPSCAAVTVRIGTRRILEPTTPIRFGMASLDRMLGRDSLFSGDVIVLHGPSGSYKTQVGLAFLLRADAPTTQTAGKRHPETPNDFEEKGPKPAVEKERISLLICARDNEPTVRSMIRRGLALGMGQYRGAPPKHIEVLPISRGFIKPGQIIQLIEEAIEDAARKDRWIDRVMVDNVSHWEMSCPFLDEDVTFGDTLVDLMRRYNMTSLFICGAIDPSDHSTIQSPIIDGADCAIQFDRFEYRGIRRVTIKVNKTRTMNHRRESFELVQTEHRLEVHPSSTLLRIGASGSISVVPIKLFLHSETDEQFEYNNTIKEAIRAVLSREADLESQDRIYMSRIMTLGANSVVDELQILQLDEFQITNFPQEVRGQPLLFQFDAAHWRGNEEWNDFLPELVGHVSSQNGFTAVPFYENFSLLAFRSDLLEGGKPNSWDDLEKKCIAWEKNEPDMGKIFFDCPRVSPENYNCLFLAILLSLYPSKEQKAVGAGRLCERECVLRAWLSDGRAVSAARIFRRLCRRAYLVAKEKKSAEARSRGTGSENTAKVQNGRDLLAIKVDTNAVVWHHWYSTLNQMFSEMPSDACDKVKLSMLPGAISIAGEWYLGVPKYSAAPDVGLEIIKLLTSREADLDRSRRGIGLPTRKSFWGTEDDTKIESVVDFSPYSSMKLGDLRPLLRNAFRRSDIPCYEKFSRLLAYQLQRIIEIPEAGESELEQRILERRIQDNFENLKARMAELALDWIPSCDFRRRRK